MLCIFLFLARVRQESGGQRSDPLFHTVPPKPQRYGMLVLQNLPVYSGCDILERIRQKKVIKKSQNSRNQGFPFYFFLMIGWSGTMWSRNNNDVFSFSRTFNKLCRKFCEIARTTCALPSASFPTYLTKIFFRFFVNMSGTSLSKKYYRAVVATVYSDLKYPGFFSLCFYD
jgi:hypothetical protein